MKNINRIWDHLCCWLQEDELIFRVLITAVLVTSFLAIGYLWVTYRLDADQVEVQHHMETVTRPSYPEVNGQRMERQGGRLIFLPEPRYMPDFSDYGEQKD